MNPLLTALLFFVALAGCAPSEVGRRWADGFDRIPQAPALAASADHSFDRLPLRIAAYPAVLGWYILMGPTEAIVNGGCAFLMLGKCEPWVTDPPYSIVVEEWQ